MSFSQQSARVLRSLRSLSTFQIAARLPRRIWSSLLPQAPGWLPPATRKSWQPASDQHRSALHAEAVRARQRLASLPRDSMILAYESAYGFDLLDPFPDHPLPCRRHVIGQPFPSSVRARRAAVAIRLGAEGLGPIIAKACRAIMLQLELDIMGNHLLENGIGLCCGGLATCGIESTLWWTTGRALLDWQIPIQFLRDGGHYERSASYHLWLTWALLELLDLARAAGKPFPRLWLETLHRALRWAARVRAPDGTFPLFNDASLDASPSIDATLHLAAILGASPPYHPEYSQRLPRLDYVEATGWLSLQADGSAWLVVDAGPDGAPNQPGHVHADALTFELWLRGERCVVDYRVESYEEGRGRQRTRTTASHNTVEVDETDACEVWGAFRVGRRQQARLHHTRLEGNSACVELSHDGYRWLGGNPIHQREICLSPGRLRIRDRIEGGKHRLVSRIRLDAANAAHLRISSASGSFLEREDVWFPRHGVARPARVLEARVEDSGSCYWELCW